jgi:hypothetical protein
MAGDDTQAVYLDDMMSGFLVAGKPAFPVDTPSKLSVYP